MHSILVDMGLIASINLPFQPNFKLLLEEAEHITKLQCILVKIGVILWQCLAFS